MTPTSRHTCTHAHTQPGHAVGIHLIDVPRGRIFFCGSEREFVTYMYDDLKIVFKTTKGNPLLYNVTQKDRPSSFVPVFEA